MQDSSPQQNALLTAFCQLPGNHHHGGLDSLAHSKNPVMGSCSPCCRRIQWGGGGVAVTTETTGSLSSGTQAKQEPPTHSPSV